MLSIASFTDLNNLIAIPCAMVFLLVGLFFTVFLKAPQIRFFSYFMQLLSAGIKKNKPHSVKTVNSFKALFTAMATSIGIGNVIGPSLAIVLGGPGALFWLVLYAFVGAATKLVEVTFAVHFRTKTTDGRIFGGPAQYLRMISGHLAWWYSALTILLFAGWSGIQARALSEILAQQAIPEWCTGLMLALVIFAILLGGIQRVSSISTALVPCMFVMYVASCLYILVLDIPALMHALGLIATCIFKPAAPLGGFVGASVLMALRNGIYKGVFITESGMGTAAIAHSMANVARPLDQGILAMYSVAADTFLCILSGLLVLTSGLWSSGTMNNTMVLTIFSQRLPYVGPLVFIICIALFIISTAIGNSFNGSQSYATLTYYRYMKWYYSFVALVIFASSMVKVSLIWSLMDLLLPFVALPHLIGLVLLAVRYKQILKL